MSNDRTVAIEEEGAVTTVVLNRTEKRNAMNPLMHREMAEVLVEVDRDREDPDRRKQRSLSSIQNPLEDCAAIVGCCLAAVESNEKGPSLEITSKCLPLLGAAEHDQLGVFM